MTLSLFSSLAFYALTVLGAIVGVCMKSNGIYLWKTSALWRPSENEKVFRKPLLLRVGAGLLGIAVLQLPLSFTASGWIVFALSLLPCLFAGRMLLLVSGPDELRIDLTKHTFRRVRGWRFCMTTWTGSVADLQCISLRMFREYKTGSRSYSVGIRGGRMGGEMKLGGFTVDDLAQRFADELVFLTDLPLVSSGPPVTTVQGQRQRPETP